MIRHFLICDNTGLPFYTRNFIEDKSVANESLAGLITAIGALGKIIFQQDISTIKFGEHKRGDQNAIVTISKELFAIKKQIFFVFFVEGTYDLQQLGALSSLIFLKAKDYLRGYEHDLMKLKAPVDAIINNTLLKPLQ